MEKFLKSNNVDEYIIKILKENDVDMEVLRTVTEQDLKDIGVNSFGKRRKLSILISKLNSVPSEYFNEDSETAPMPNLNFTNNTVKTRPEATGQLPATTPGSRHVPYYLLHKGITAATSTSFPSNSEHVPSMSKNVPSFSEHVPSTSKQVLSNSEQVPTTSDQDFSSSKQLLFNPEQDHRKALKRMRTSGGCPLEFDLVGEISKHIDGRNYLSVKDQCIPPSNKQRKLIVNIAVASLVAQRGLYPTGADKTLLAQEIIRVFPATRDTTPGMEGYEHFYKNGKGFIEFRLKNLRISFRPGRKFTRKKYTQNKPRKEESTNPSIVIDDAVKEKVDWMKSFSPTVENEHTHRQFFSDTFQYRRQLVEQGCTATRIITEFPRFRDMPDLINHEFGMFYKDKVDCFHSRWNSYFTNRVLTHGNRENKTITDLIESYENGDHDLCALIVVFKLIHSNTWIKTDPDRGHEEFVSSMDFLIQHVCEGTDVDAFACNKGKIFTQPFILAVGPTICPTQYYVIVDNMAVEAGMTAISGFDICFKLHNIFNLDYSSWTNKFWQFICIHVYGIQCSTTTIVRYLGVAINNTCVSSPDSENIITKME